MRSLTFIPIFTLALSSVTAFNEQDRIGRRAQVPGVAAAGTAPAAAGVPPVAAGVPPVAAGVPPVAAGVPPVAAGVPPVAAGVPPVAAGVPPVAAGVPPVAAGVPPVAAGVPPVAAAGAAEELDIEDDFGASGAAPTPGGAVPAAAGAGVGGAIPAAAAGAGVGGAVPAAAAGAGVGGAVPAAAAGGLAAGVGTPGAASGLSATAPEGDDTEGLEETDALAGGAADKKSGALSGSDDFVESGYVCLNNFHRKYQIDKTLKKACKKVNKKSRLNLGSLRYPKLFKPEDGRSNFSDTLGKLYQFPIPTDKTYSVGKRARHDRIVFNDQCTLAGMVIENKSLKVTLSSGVDKESDFQKCVKTYIKKSDAEVGAKDTENEDDQSEGKEVKTKGKGAVTNADAEADPDAEE